MYIIIGLGNPTKKYSATRHNIGFDVIDSLALAHGIKVNTNKHKALCGKGIIYGNNVVLAKPLTYMNLSGESVRAIIDFYKADIESELIVIYDDIDLDLGQVRVRLKGSAGGHNGMKSIISHLSSQNFYRVRVGIGNKPEEMQLADYVLSHFDKIDRSKADEGIKDAVGAIETIISSGIEKSMNKYNISKKQL